MFGRLLPLAFLALAGSARSDVSFEPAQYSYAHIARSLSVDGHRVTCEDRIKDRLAALSLKKRTWEATTDLLSHNLGIQFRPLKDGSVVLEADSVVAALERKRFDTYVATYDAEVQRRLSWIESMFPDGLDAKSFRAQYDLAYPNPQSQVQRPVEDRRSIRFLECVGGGRVDGPIYEFLKTCSVRQAIEQDYLATWNWQAYADDHSMPDWVRACYDPAPDSYVGGFHAPKDPAELPAFLRDLRAGRQVGLSASFDPSRQTLIFESGVLQLYPSVRPELRGCYTFSGVVTDPRFDKPPNDVQQAIDETRTFLHTDLAKTPLRIREPNSIAGQLLQWARDTKKDLIAEVSPATDWRAPLGPLASHYVPAWAIDGKVIESTSPLAPPVEAHEPMYPFWLALKFKDDVLVGRNMMHFIERFYESPGEKFEPILNRGDGEVPTPYEFVKVAASLSESEMHRALRGNLGLAIQDYPRSLPALAFVGRLPETVQKEVLEGKAHKKVVRDIRAEDFAAVGRFESDVESLTSPRTRFGPAPCPAWEFMLHNPRTFSDLTAEFVWTSPSNLEVSLFTWRGKSRTSENKWLLYSRVINFPVVNPK